MNSRQYLALARPAISCSGHSATFVLPSYPRLQNGIYTPPLTILSAFTIHTHTRENLGWSFACVYIYYIYIIHPAGQTHHPQHPYVLYIYIYKRRACETTTTKTHKPDTHVTMSLFMHDATTEQPLRCRYIFCGNNLYFKAATHSAILYTAVRI